MSKENELVHDLSNSEILYPSIVGARVKKIGVSGGPNVRR